MRSRATIGVGMLVGALACACGGSKSQTVTPTPAAAIIGVRRGYEGPVTPEQIALSHDNAKKIVAAATQWTALHPEGACPSVAQLKADRLLGVMAQDTDAWGRPFLLICAETEAEVRSDGPDGLGNTRDDVLEKAGLTAPVTVTALPGRLDVQVAPDAGAFSAQVGMAAIDQKVAACEQKANEDPSMHGKVALHLVVRDDGTVKSAVVVRSKTSARSPQLLACVLKEVVRMQLGPTPSHDEVTFEY